MTSSSEKFDLSGESALKAIFRNHASGIALITSRTAAGEPIGFTASSVTSLGSNPPLVSVNIAQGSSSYPHLQIGTKLALHTLDAQTLHLAKRLAGPKENRFDGTEVIGPFGLPIFEQCPSILIAEVIKRFEVESNAVLVLAVADGKVNRIPDQPLIYFQRAWHTIGDKLSDNF
jgi:flavin reductase (DIM6/NTAB) family NADH-FMN oxidoreductase RutF